LYQQQPKTKLLRWWDNTNRQQNVGIDPLFACRDNKRNIRAAGSSGIYKKTPPPEQTSCSPGVFLYNNQTQYYFGGGTTPIVNKMLA
jgi:hypothetical protein